MPLHSWSFRRIAVLWVVGLALEAAMFVGLMAFTRHLVARDFPSLHAQMAERNARDEGQDRASAASREEQVRAARERGEFTITPSGDTAFAVVTTPSGRARSGPLTATAIGPSRTGSVLALLMFGAIPMGLLVLTAAWAYDQRRPGVPAA